MHSPCRSSSAMAVMGEAFKRSFPLDRDLPPALSAALARLAAVEANEVRPLPSGKMRVAEQPLVREPQMA